MPPTPWIRRTANPYPFKRRRIARPILGWEHSVDGSSDLGDHHKAEHQDVWNMGGASVEPTSMDWESMESYNGSGRNSSSLPAPNDLADGFALTVHITSGSLPVAHDRAGYLKTARSVDGEMGGIQGDDATRIVKIMYPESLLGKRRRLDLDTLDKHAYADHDPTGPMNTQMGFLADGDRGYVGRGYYTGHALVIALSFEPPPDASDDVTH